MAEILQSPQDVCLECLCFRLLAAMGEVLTEWVAGGVPPRGAFNPPPTVGVQGVLDPNPIVCQIRQDRSQMANLKGQALDAGPGS